MKECLLSFFLFLGRWQLHEWDQVINQQFKKEKWGQNTPWIFKITSFMFEGSIQRLCNWIMGQDLFYQHS